MENLMLEMQEAIAARDRAAVQRLIDQSDKEEWRGHRLPDENCVYLEASRFVLKSKH